MEAQISRIIGESQILSNWIEGLKVLFSNSTIINTNYGEVMTEIANNFISNPGLSKACVAEFGIQLRKSLNDKFGNNFWEKLEKEDTVQYLMNFHECVKEIYNSYSKYKNFIEKIVVDQSTNLNLMVRFKHEFECIISSSKFNMLCNHFYFTDYITYENFCKHYSNENFDNEMSDSPTLSRYIDFLCVKNKPIDSNYDFQNLSHTSSMIIAMDWLSNVEESCNLFIYKQIDNKIAQCKENFKLSIIKDALTWLESVMLKWLQHALNVDSRFLNNQLFQAWKGRIQSYLLREFGRMRFEEMIEIVINYPESEPTLSDLKYILEKTNLYNELASVFKSLIAKRLLTPGVSTSLIIECYINTIKIMKILDPTTLLFEIVSEPIKAHLRPRPDTLRSIISSFLEEDNNELYNDLGKQNIKPTVRKDLSKIRGHSYKSIVDEDSEIISSDEDEEAASNWEPAPINLELGKVISTKLKQSDIVSTLVNIYATPEALLKEYQNMLSERLLGSEFLHDFEVKNIELLKVRFGDSFLHHCDVMMKDMKESDRIYSQINDIDSMKKNVKQKDLFIPMKALKVAIISKDFWPKADEHISFQIPSHMQPTFEAFAKKYSEIKQMRTLVFNHNLGNVSIKLQFENGTFPFEVSPLHAIIISFFAYNNKNISVKEISNQLNLPVSTIRKKLSFWINKGVLRECTVYKNTKFGSPQVNPEQESYVAVKVLERKSEAVSEDASSDAKSRNQGSEEEKSKEYYRKLIEGYIIAMLNTTGPKKENRIEEFLKKCYLSNEVIEKFNVDSLIKESIEKLVQNGKIIKNDELYQLN